MIEILPLIGSLITVILGILALLLPNAVAATLGIAAKSALGRAEIRATYGGFFVGLGLVCLWFQSDDAFIVAGVAWMGAAIGRAISMAMDRAFSARNFGGIAVEGGIGAMFLITLL